MDIHFTHSQKWVLGVYAVAGFLAAPAIVRSEAEQALGEELGRGVRIEAVRINPFALSASVHGFALSNADGSSFVEFEELYVDFQLSSLFRRAYTFDEVRLSSPFVHVKILPDGALSFAGLLEGETAEQPESEPEATDTALPAALVFLAKISGGKVLFSDLSHQTPCAVLRIREDRLRNVGLA